jgi:hypothetical protein
MGDEKKKRSRRYVKTPAPNIAHPPEIAYLMLFSDIGRYGVSSQRSGRKYWFNLLPAGPLGMTRTDREQYKNNSAATQLA